MSIPDESAVVNPLTPAASLNFGEVISSSFKVYRRRFGPLIGLSLILALAVAGLTGLYLLWFMNWVMNYADKLYRTTPPELIWGTTLSVSVLTLLLVVVGWWSTLGFCALADAELTGQSLSLGQAIKVAINRVTSLLPIALVVAAGIAAFTLGIMAWTTQFLDLGTNPDNAVGTMIVTILLVTLGSLIAVVVSYYLQAKLFLTFPVMVVEARSIWKALPRSWRITKGSALINFLIIFVVGIVVGAVTSVSTLPLLPAGIAMGMGSVGALTIGLIAMVVLMAIAIVFTAPFLPVASQVVYRNVGREQNELARYAEPKEAVDERSEEHRDRDRAGLV
ncbi:MAG: glycerophosphoryl diester phosphodiesterase membrane domain-containing protein [Propionibacteriaceae bacterium]|jgi:hypothetical protein|nr:glycerophosphoryl diester phosphodiesterase membrane domain-containing protein [Propionibacteriaceae bacterium]